ncbi:MAG: glycosyltransferase family 9 protein [Janthinobacterium lividum]
MSLQNLAKALFFRSVRLVTARQQLDANSILVLQAMLPLGGCVHATPLFSLLKKDLPNLPVWVATRGLGLEVLRHNPDVAGLIPLPDVFTAFQTAGRALRSGLKAHDLRPAGIVLDSSNPRTKVALLGSLYVGAPLVGYSEATSLLQVPLSRDSRNRSLLEDNLAIGKALGTSTTHYEPRVCISAPVADEAKQLLSIHNPNGRPVAILSTQPSGGQPTAWHVKRFAEVADMLASKGFLPVFVGTAVQSGEIDQLRDLMAAVSVSLAGKTDVRLLAAVLAMADLCITIDTGTMHVARAVGVPMVVLAPIFQSGTEWLPLHIARARVLRGDGIHPVPQNYRLDEIEVPEVLTAIDSLLREYPPSVAAREARLAASVTDVDHLA